jgi:hypothetical protein
MHSVTQALPAEQPHRNHGLFSDHYLNVTLPQRSEWQDLADEARSVMESVAQIFDSYVPSGNEAQTERDLVRPVLDILGHDYEVQPTLETPDGTKRPDYVLYKDAAAVAIASPSNPGPCPPPCNSRVDFCESQPG